MIDSNRTLRFPRSYREATGTGFYGPNERDWQDKLAAWIVCMGVVFLSAWQ